MKTIETMAEALTGSKLEIWHPNVQDELKRQATDCLKSIHEPDPHVVAIVADKLKMDPTKVAAVWMLMIEELGK